MLRGSRFFLPVLMTLGLLTAGSCGGSKQADDPAKAAKTDEAGKVPPEADKEKDLRSGRKGFALTSPEFFHHGAIPARVTCDGEGVSPEVDWENAPEGVKSFVLLVDDPDAEPSNFVHWLVFNLPPDVRTLKGGMPSDPVLSDPKGAMQVVNGFGKPGWGGPCPPPGKPHRYVFRMYALDTLLDLGAGSSRSQVEDAMKGHFLGQAALIASYARGGKG